MHDCILILEMQPDWPQYKTEIDCFATILMNRKFNVVLVMTVCFQIDGLMKYNVLILSIYPCILFTKCHSLCYQ